MSTLTRTTHPIEVVIIGVGVIACGPWCSQVSPNRLHLFASIGFYLVLRLIDTSKNNPTMSHKHRVNYQLGFSGYPILSSTCYAPPAPTIATIAKRTPTNVTRKLTGAKAFCKSIMLIEESHTGTNASPRATMTMNQPHILAKQGPCPA